MLIATLGVIIAFFTLVVGVLQYIVTRKQRNANSNDNETEVTIEKTTIEITRTKTKK